jgi:hypothetical protein
MRDARLDLVRLARLFHAPKRLEHPVQQMTNQCGRFSPSVSRNGFFLADNVFEPDVKYVEENPNVAVAFQVTPVRQASREHGKKLYSILAGILKNRPLKFCDRSRIQMVWRHGDSCTIYTALRQRDEQWRF